MHVGGGDSLCYTQKESRQAEICGMPRGERSLKYVGYSESNATFYYIGP